MGPHPLFSHAEPVLGVLLLPPPSILRISVHRGISEAAHGLSEEFC